MRGLLPEDAAIKAALQVRYKTETGLDLDKTNLHLLPYIQYVLMNEQIVDRAKLSREEAKIIKDLRDAGCLGVRSNGKFQCTDRFWACMNEILYYTYVDRGEK